MHAREPVSAWAAGQGETLAEGVEMARAALSDGRATRVLEHFVAFTREHAPESP